MININIDPVNGMIEPDNYISITFEPQPIRYDEEYAINKRNEVTIGAKSWLPEEYKEKIRRDLVDRDGYYNVMWHQYLSNFRIDEEFIREIFEYIGIDFLRQYMYFTTDFERELENNPLVGI